MIDILYWIALLIGVPVIYTAMWLIPAQIIAWFEDNL